MFIARDATVAWEPSVFGGDGTEKRVNLVLRVAEHIRTAMHSIEANAAAEQMCSMVHEDTIKVKLDLTTVRIWGDDNLPAEAPDQWKGRVVHACIEVRGFWTSRMGTGVSAVCTDLQLVDNAQPPMCPFLEHQEQSAVTVC